MPLRFDFTVIHDGSIFLLHPLTRAARDWADKYIDPTAHHFGKAIVVEHHYIIDVIEGIRADGLEVR
jgi:hypothetical protein